MLLIGYVGSAQFWYSILLAKFPAVHGPAQTTRMPVMVDLGGMAMPVLNDALVPIIVYHCVSERLRKEVNVVLYVHKNHKTC